MRTLQQQINIREAIAMMDAVPPCRVNLKHWRIDKGMGNMSLSLDSECSTLACFGGWCTVWPAFQAQGLQATSLGTPIIHDICAGSMVAELLFGDANLFSGRTSFETQLDISDHAVIGRRLQLALSEFELDNRIRIFQ